MTHTPLATLALFLLTLTGCVATMHPAKIPVILDTDIGDDIDDTWAVAILLNTPTLDVKLIMTTNGAPHYRARIIAKLLTIANRTDIPIGLGAGTAAGSARLSPWIADFPLTNYHGPV